MSEPFSARLPGFPAGHTRAPAILIPVKPVAIGKSRLRTSPVAADALVAAIALDTIAAALAALAILAGGPGTGAGGSGSSVVEGAGASVGIGVGGLGAGDVIVITNDPVVGAAATGLGARVLPDMPDSGLVPAITFADRVVGSARLRGVLTADLPALRPAELAAAITAAIAATPAGSATDGRADGTTAGRVDRSGGLVRAFVADHAGTGTTLLIAQAGVPLDPRFGPGSAAAHAGSGARALTGDWPSLRLDVDTPDDLAAAAALGLGPRSAEFLAAALDGPVARC